MDKYAADLRTSTVAAEEEAYEDEPHQEAATYFGLNHKCKFWEEEVKFMGHVVKVEGIAVNLAKVEAVSKWDQPTTVTEVRSFLVMARYYRCFIKEFSRIAWPLTQLTKKNNRFTWDENTEAAFQELKMRLIFALVLTLPQEGETFVVYSDASKLGLGCVLT
ncbi:uncharacterized mitochondrial protein AtMg00860-like [Magnolia sinica]|uniref:uncharacterized mitochondrial protein AtMg00860-like n=1 Tax=Magnolia sinica TaxID=86752 RepID=UPI0026593868|nr:uncharacterized mitochondrial protein AtMg00860-like [Magnolia sinica]